MERIIHSSQEQMKRRSEEQEEKRKEKEELKRLRENYERMKEYFEKQKKVCEEYKKKYPNDNHKYEDYLVYKAKLSMEKSKGEILRFKEQHESIMERAARLAKYDIQRVGAKTFSYVDSVSDISITVSRGGKIIKIVDSYKELTTRGPYIEEWGGYDTYYDLLDGTYANKYGFGRDMIPNESKLWTLISGHSPSLINAITNKNTDEILYYLNKEEREKLIKTLLDSSRWLSKEEIPFYQKGESIKTYEKKRRRNIWKN